jgi:hypothetical protein
MAPNPSSLSTTPFTGTYIGDTLRIPRGCLEDVLRYKRVKTSSRHPPGKAIKRSWVLLINY